jgi:hypothetical protein
VIPLTFVKADSSPLLLESITNRQSLAHLTQRGRRQIFCFANFENLEKLSVDSFAILSEDKTSGNFRDIVNLTV